MKKTLLFCAITLNFLFLASFAAAKTLGQIVDDMLSVVYGLAIAIAPVMIIISGFYFLTAGGNPERIEKAKKAILYAVIGLIIVIAANGIVALLEQIIK